ncbi:MAG TPA: OmpA family protein, partial [Myxococcota bacterium]
MIRRPGLVVVAFAAFVAVVGSCAGPRIAAQTDVVRTDIKKAKESGAYTCAPRELALAESNVDFAENELAQGDALRAQAHIDIAVDNANKALALSKGCAPQLQQVKVSGDRDGDGIVDDVDACPDQPEDKD